MMRPARRDRQRPRHELTEIRGAATATRGLPGRRSAGHDSRLTGYQTSGTYRWLERGGRS